MTLEKTHRMNTLFSFYGPLLTDKQQDYMHLYYGEDLTLAEIADSFEVSRQAVYDAIKRTEKVLEDYEDKLKMVNNFINYQMISEKAQAYVKESYPEDKVLIDILKEFN